MADIQYSGGYPSDHGYEYGQEQAAQMAPAEVSRATLLINWAGAIVSIALVVGMAIWAWQLLTRDVADVPVIRALEGPMRMAPEDPGGAVAANQGLAVNRLAEGEEAAPVPDQLVLAPPPMDLGEVPPPEQAFENASVAATSPDAVVAEAPSATAEAVLQGDAAADVAGAPGGAGTVDAAGSSAAVAALAATPEVEDTSALIERLLTEAQPRDADGASRLPTAADDPHDGAPGSNLVARAGVIPISVPGVRRSPRPALRPAGIQARAQAAPAAVPAGEASAGDAVTESESGFEIASAELQAGTRLVQLGAFDTPDLARTEWQRLSQSYPDFFLGRARVIEQASSGGQTFYRLRAHGFGDLSASRRFCAALVAQGTACIPVTVR